MKKIALSILLSSGFVFGQETKNDKMDWFTDAKLGIFIHWGIYSVNGISESWSFFNGYTSYSDYYNQTKGFSAKNYNPKQWVDLIKNSGAKYAVITSKHHDGIALWNTTADKGLSTTKNTLAKRDVLTPFVSELKKSGLKTGIYYSLPDWSHQNYDIFTRTEKRYDYKQNPERFQKFVDFYQYQLKEISQLYNPDLYWFDGDWEHSAQEWKTADTRKLLLAKNPRTIINARLTEQGDYDTPEQGIPMQSPSAKHWELCYTMNDSWGYQGDDKNYKSSNQLIRTLVECISMGGNLLLDIGPKEDGTIPQKQVDILKDIGRWTKKHSEAIYGTEKGISQKYFSGKSALSKDKKSLFLYFNDDQNGKLWLRNIASEIEKIKLVGEDISLKYNKLENDIWIEFPKEKADKDVSVVRVDFKDEISFSKENLVKIEGSEVEQIKRLSYLLSEGKNPFPKNKVLQNDAFTDFTSNKKVNRWIKKHAEIFQNPTKKGLSESRYAGMSALSEDERTLFLFIDGKTDGNLLVKGLTNGIQRIRIVGEGSILPHKIYDKLYWSAAPGLVSISVPKHRMDEQVTIIAIMLDSPLKEYDKEITAVESN